MSKPKTCPSCPFLKTNFEEFGVVAKALSKKHGQPEPDFFQIETIRRRVCADAIESGKLACHASVYDSKMNVSLSKAIPCAGLELHLKEQKSKPKKKRK